MSGTLVTPTHLFTSGILKRAGIDISRLIDPSSGELDLPVFLRAVMDSGQQFIAVPGKSFSSDELREPKNMLELIKSITFLRHASNSETQSKGLFSNFDAENDDFQMNAAQCCSTLYSLLAPEDRAGRAIYIFPIDKGKIKTLNKSANKKIQIHPNDYNKLIIELISRIGPDMITTIYARSKTDTPDIYNYTLSEIEFGGNGQTLEQNPSAERLANLSTLLLDLTAGLNTSRLQQLLKRQEKNPHLLWSMVDISALETTLVEPPSSTKFRTGFYNGKWSIVDGDVHLKSPSSIEYADEDSTRMTCNGRQIAIPAQATAEEAETTLLVVNNPHTGDGTLPGLSLIWVAGKTDMKLPIDGSAYDFTKASDITKNAFHTTAIQNNISKNAAFEINPKVDGYSKVKIIAPERPDGSFSSWGLIDSLPPRTSLDKTEKHLTATYFYNRTVLHLGDCSEKKPKQPFLLGVAYHPSLYRTRNYSLFLRTNGEPYSALPDNGLRCPVPVFAGIETLMNDSGIKKMEDKLLKGKNPCDFRTNPSLAIRRLSHSGTPNEVAYVIAHFYQAIRINETTSTGKTAMDLAEARTDRDGETVVSILQQTGFYNAKKLASHGIATPGAGAGTGAGAGASC